MASSSGEPVKELYMAKSMEELNKKTSAKNMDYSTPKLLGRSSNALFLAAKDAALQKDEEKAYILFMRFMELVKKIRTSKEYKSRKAEYDKLIPGSKIQKALSEAERISESLRERYAAPQEKRQKLDAVDQSQGEGVGDQQVPNDSKDGNDQPKSAADVYRQSNGNALVPQQQLAPPTSVGDVIKNGFLTDSQSSSSSMSITAQDLFSLLKSSPDDVIVLDCRPRSMFLSSHPDGRKYPQWLSVPEELIQKGVTCESIERFQGVKGRKMWAERASKLAIVLVDCGTTSSDISTPEDTGLPLLQLRDAIHKYDTTVELTRPPVLLEGGYTQWYLHYSPLCVGPWKWGRGGGEGEGGEGGGGASGNSLDYPSFPEILETVEEGGTDLVNPDAPLVAMEKAIQDPSNDHTPQPPHPTQIVPLAPQAHPIPHALQSHTHLPHPNHTHSPHPTHTLSHIPAQNHTLQHPSAPNPTHLPHPPAPNSAPLPHPPVGNVPIPVYQPPPVMTILSLDDPNLNAEDPSVQLSTMPENQFANVAADPRMQLQGVVQPVLQPVNPVVQSSRYQFVDGVQANQQTGQQFGTDWQLGQAPVPVHSQSGQSHPHIGQYEQHNTGQIGQSHPPTGQSQIVNPVIDQVYSSHQQMHHSQPQSVHHTSPPSAQTHPPTGQPTSQTGQSHPLIVQGTQPGQQLYQQHPAQTNAHVASQMGQSHPTIVQPTPQIGLHNPGIAQTALNSNQRVTYGPIPNPPGYEQALNFPSQAPPPEPLPPPVGLPVPNQSNQLQNQFDGQGGQFFNPVAPHSAEYYQTGYSQQHVYTAPHQGGQAGNQFPYQVQPVPPGNQFSNPVELVPQPGNGAADAGAEKIRELERQLKTKEESERARMQREKEAILHAKQKWEEEKLREGQEFEQRKLELAQEQAALVKGKEDLEKMRLQVEEEREQSVKDSEQLRQMLQIQQSAQRDQRAFTVNQGLPAGWEKRLEHTTGRFYYVDHNSKTTHWNPPANWLNYQSQLQQRRTNERGVVGQIPGRQNVVPAEQISQQLPPGQHPPVGRHDNLQPTGGSLSHAHQQPSALPQQPQIRKIATPTSVSGQQPGHPVSKPVVPSVDRSSKPQMPASTPSVDRSTKPTMSPAEYKRKLNALQPMFGSSQAFGLTGLRNLGNTCFMNSTLQCLCATTPFVSYFLQGRYLKDSNRSNPLGHGGILADEFSFLMKAMWSRQYRFISPRDFKEVISQFAPTFSGTQQHDSQEFLAFLMDGLHEDLNRVLERRYIQNPDYSRYDDRQAASIAWSLHKKRNDSIIVDLFQGQFRSTLHCLTCRHRSVNFEAFMYLSIPLPPGNNPCTLKDCIKLFTKEERVSGSDKWYCSSCKQHRDASKRIEIWKLPAILLIHLKRFSYDGVWRQKKQNSVDFPFTGLNMSADVVGGTDGPQEYRLFGVSNHFGTLTGGHYTAVCFNPSTKQFYNFDDHEIKAVPQRQVKSSAAYLLFYTSMELSVPKVL